MLSDGTHSYTWDARNRLTKIDSGTTASFGYDPFGRRYNKNILGTNTNFLYDGANAVQEVIGGTNTANSLMGGIDEVFQRTDSSGARSFLTDALGSTLALADSPGTLQTQYTFDPFGNTTQSGTSTTNSFAYTGRELDAGNLYYYRARYYNPQLQRFISEDPARLRGGLNFYSYVFNSPLNGTDSSGLFAPPWHVVISYAAAILSGSYSLQGASDFGADVAAVDAYPGTQRPDAHDSNTHAMSGRKWNGNPQSCGEALQGAEQQLVDDINGGHIAMAAHTIEDNYAAGHRGFQFWPGGIPNEAHESGDWNPDLQDVYLATRAVAQFLEDLNANKASLDRGQSIDTSKYFGQSPCSPRSLF